MTKKQLLNDLANNVYCQIKPSSIDGVGVFAIRVIPKATNPFLSSKEVNLISLTKEEVISLPAPIRKMLNDFCAYRKDRYLVPDFGLNAIDISHFLNSSKNPNVTAKKTKSGDIEFITNRKIKRGEELTADYNTFSEDHQFDTSISRKNYLGL